jgi:hydrophobe/amphiphile efflux-1 (HAE1) family protein
VNISAPFIARPIATVLLMVALFAGGVVGYNLLPVAALPTIDFPTLTVSASLPGADPETMASSVAQPLERQFANLPSVNQITSISVLGATQISLQFDLSRSLDGAASDVQAAINAAQGFLPKNLPTPPTYRKVNPADHPVLILGLTSDSVPLTDLDRYADLNLAQRIAAMSGVGQVAIFGERKYAPTIMVNPQALAARGIGLDDVAGAIAGLTADLPVGTLQGPQTSYQIGTNGQLFDPEEIGQAIVVYRNGAPVRVKDIAKVTSGAESPLQMSWVGTRPGEMIGVWRQPGANTIELVDRVLDALPAFEAGIPKSITVSLVSDRSVSIRESFTDVKLTLLGTVFLVVLVIFVFLRSFWPTLIPSVTVPLSIVGTFAVMYMLGYSLDNLSLMALTIAAGLVVDDAIVMLENVFRYLEQGCDRVTAALRGSEEIGFTIVSITVSLIAVFIPMLFMSGIVGRLFREFGIVVSVAVVLSAMIALTLSPVMASLVLEDPTKRGHGRVYQWSERAFSRVVGGYERWLTVTLRHRRTTMTVNLLLLALSGFLFYSLPKGFFPQEDTGLVFGFTDGDRDVSFEGMSQRQEAVLKVIEADPDVAAFGASIGGSSSSGLNTGRIYIQLKPLSERTGSAQQFIDRLRPKLAEVPGITTYMQSMQNIQIGARLSRTQYQYTLQDIDLDELNQWAPKMLAKLKTIPGLQDVASDQQTGASRLMIHINRDNASRLGVNIATIQQTLYDAFGQPFVAQLYGSLNTYHVVIEVEPRYQTDVSALSRIYVHGAGGRLIPLSQFATFETQPTALSVNHQGQFPAVTLSFNLARGYSLGQAVQSIQRAEAELDKPATVQTSFQGTAADFQSSLSTQPLLIAAALFAVYIVLGVLYESFAHPITILLTLPPASVGALLALKLFGLDLSMMAIIGLIMLIGIVKKNAIMMIDFALERMRSEGKSAEEAAFEAAVFRFRPIMMTTMSAVLGTLPIAIGIGAGADLRQPLGISVVAGLLVSQALTLFTAPVTFIYMEQLSEWVSGEYARLRGAYRRRAATD